MDFTFYDEQTGDIRFVASGSTAPAPENGAYIDGRYDAKLYRIVDGQAVKKPEAEIEEREIEAAWLDLRKQRDARLQDSDWTQVPDAPVDQAAWALYRQELRDLPANTDDPRDVVWPQEP